MSTIFSNKYADTVPAVHQLFRERWSPRSFEPRNISDSDLQAILEAGRWAASSYNEQPWRFLVAKRSDEQAFAKFLSILAPFNQAWAKNASVLLFTFGKKHFTHNQNENRHALHDAGAAAAYMTLEATALGLEGHGMAAFDADRAIKELGVPDDYEAGAAFAFGYADAPEKLEMEAKYVDMEKDKRQRKPLQEIAFNGTWGNPVKF